MTRSPLTWCAAILCLVLAASAWMLATAGASALGKFGVAADSLAALPATLDARMAKFQTVVDRMPSKLLPPVLASVDAAIADTDSRVQQLADLADARTVDALVLLKQGLTTADARFASIQADARPVLVNAAALVKDGQDSLDDLYPDVRGLTESATVAVTSVAQASEAMRAAAPQLATSAVGIGKSAEGIAADVHSLASDFARPKTRWQKFKKWIVTRIL